MENIIIGQLAELVWENKQGDANWCYCVVERIFDDRIQFIKEDGGKYMLVLEENDQEGEIIDNQTTKTHLTMLNKDGKPVIAKKRLFGKGYKI